RTRRTIGLSIYINSPARHTGGGLLFPLCLLLDVMPAARVGQSRHTPPQSSRARVGQGLDWRSAPQAPEYRMYAYLAWPLTAITAPTAVPDVVPRVRRGALPAVPHACHSPADCPSPLDCHTDAGLPRSTPDRSSVLHASLSPFAVLMTLCHH